MALTISSSRILKTTNNKHQTIEEPSLIVKLPLLSTVPPCKKRGAESLDVEDDAELKANLAIRARASKRQKLPLVRQEDKVDRPQPRDEPQVWAEVTTLYISNIYLGLLNSFI